MIDKVKEVRSRFENDSDPIAVICDYLIELDKAFKEAKEEVQEDARSQNVTD